LKPCEMVQCNLVHSLVKLTEYFNTPIQHAHVYCKLRLATVIFVLVQLFRELTRGKENIICINFFVAVVLIV